MNTIDTAIALALSSYAKSSVKENAAPITKIVERPEQKLVKVERKPRTVILPPPPKAVEAKSSAPSVKLPIKGTLDAKGYVLAMRSAKDRDAKIQAIAAFIGYDPKGDFGSQEMAANFAAKRALSPIAAGPDRQEVRSAQRSALGYVKGMPDLQAKKLNDLLGREKMAAETMSNAYKAADQATTQEEKSHHMALALLEKERLTAIQAEIQTLV